MINLRKSIQILRIGGLRNTICVLTNELLRRINSNEIHWGLVYDLNVNQDLNNSDRPMPVRPLKPSDVKKLYSSHDLNVQTHDLRTVFEHLIFLEADVSTPYVWVDVDDNPMAICWLISAQSNHMLQHYFGNGLPALGENDILLEFIYTRPDCRGRQLMLHLTQALFRIGRQSGKQKAFAYINSDNKSSLAGCKKIGWEPYLKKLITWRWFKRRIQFQRFEEMTADEHRHKDEH